MILKLIEEKENKLLNRKELLLETTYTGPTPNTQEIKKAVVETLKSKDELIVINKINQIFGTRKAIIKAKLYNSSEDLKKVEVINKKPKKKIEEKKPNG